MRGIEEHYSITVLHLHTLDNQTVRYYQYSLPLFIHHSPINKSGPSVESVRDTKYILGISRSDLTRSYQHSRDTFISINFQWFPLIRSFIRKILTETDPARGERCSIVASISVWRTSMSPRYTSHSASVKLLKYSDSFSDLRNLIRIINITKFL